MKRRTKLFLAFSTLICLGIVGVILLKILKYAAQPFPGAVVILDDASWRSLWVGEEPDSGYLWAASNTILGGRDNRGGLHATLYRLLPDGTASPPQPLPFLLTEQGNLVSLSRDGKTLCLLNGWVKGGVEYRLVRLEGQEKPLILTTEPMQLHWSPDSRFLYGMAASGSDAVLKRFDAKTGSVVKTPINVPEEMDLDMVTPEGKLLFFAYDSDPSVDPRMEKWRIGELQGGTVHIKAYQRRFPPDTLLEAMSPNGKRLLWRVESAEDTFWERIQSKMLQKRIPPKRVIIWQVTDIDGSHALTLGGVTEQMKKTMKSDPEWTPDSKGVHFIMDGKLWYLPVP